MNDSCMMIMTNENQGATPSTCWIVHVNIKTGMYSLYHHHPHHDSHHTTLCPLLYHQAGVGILLPPTGVGILLPPVGVRTHLPPHIYVWSSAMDSFPHERHQHAKPLVVSSLHVEEVLPKCKQKDKEMEVLQVTLSMPDSYPPPPILTVALPIVPRCLPSPSMDFENDSNNAPPRGKGKKGGPSVPSYMQSVNWQVNTNEIGRASCRERVCLAV